MIKSAKELASIEYRGGFTFDSEEAIKQLIQECCPIEQARILTHDKRHGFLLTTDTERTIAILPGFTSGYGGTGPRCFSYTIKLLDFHGVKLDEYNISKKIMERFEQSAFLLSDLDLILSSDPIRPKEFWYYIWENHFNSKDGAELWRHFRPIIPLGLIDKRIIDLAKNFIDDPEGNLFNAHRRLEDIVRSRIKSDEHGKRVLSKAFHGQNSKLYWKDISENEQIGRGNLFTGAYMAYRNPRAHREMDKEYSKQVSEFLLVNHLFDLESTALERNDETEK